MNRLERSDIRFKSSDMSPDFVKKITHKYSPSPSPNSTTDTHHPQRYANSTTPACTANSNHSNVHSLHSHQHNSISSTNHNPSSCFTPENALGASISHNNSSNPHQPNQLNLSMKNQNQNVNLNQNQNLNVAHNQNHNQDRNSGANVKNKRSISCVPNFNKKNSSETRISQNDSVPGVGNDSDEIFHEENKLFKSIPNDTHTNNISPTFGVGQSLNSTTPLQLTSPTVHTSTRRPPYSSTNRKKLEKYDYNNSDPRKSASHSPKNKKQAGQFHRKYNPKFVYENPCIFSKKTANISQRSGEMITITPNVSLNFMNFL